MKGLIVTQSELASIKAELYSLKVEKKRLYGKIERNTADCWDNTDLDRILGKIEGIEFVLKTIGAK